MDQYYMDEYDQYPEGEIFFDFFLCVFFLITLFFCLIGFCFFTNVWHLGRNYGDEGYPIPNEEDYYEQDPRGQGNPDNIEPQSPSISSTKKTKPMPKESSFFVFSSKNR